MFFPLLRKAGGGSRAKRVSSLGLAYLQLILLFWLASPQAGATRADCEKALLAVQAVLGEGPKTESYSHGARGQSSPTVRIEASIQGEHGGQRLVLKRTGARWLSDYRSVNFDPQGDPRWFIETMGSEAAEFFGFKILDDDRVIVPDGIEFSGALKKINAQLLKMAKEPIEISFYVTASDTNTNVAKYVRAYGETHGLPMAPSGNHLLHDLSFHSGAIFIPGDLVRLSGYFARFLDGYLEFMQQKYQHDPEQAKAAKHIAFLMRMNHTVTIDSSTGTVNPGIVASLRKPGLKESLEILFTPTVLISGEGHNARSYFEKKIKALSATNKSHISEYHGLAPTERIIEALKSLSTNQLLEDLNEFAAQKRVPGHQLYDSVYVPQTVEVLESFCKGISQRRLVIRQAAIALKSSRL